MDASTVGDASKRRSGSKVATRSSKAPSPSKSPMFLEESVRGGRPGMMMSMRGRGRSPGSLSPGESMRFSPGQSMSMMLKRGSPTTNMPLDQSFAGMRPLGKMRNIKVDPLRTGSHDPESMMASSMALRGRMSSRSGGASGGTRPASPGSPGGSPRGVPAADGLPMLDQSMRAMSVRRAGNSENSPPISPGGTRRTPRRDGSELLLMMEEKALKRQAQMRVTEERKKEMQAKTARGAQLIRNLLMAKQFAFSNRPLQAFKRTWKASESNRTPDEIDQNDKDDLWMVIQACRGDTTGGVMSLPNAKELGYLPINLQMTFSALAKETLEKFLYPRALLWVRRRERSRLLSSSTLPKLTPAVLLRQNLFKECTPQDVEGLIEKLVLMVYEKGEYILNEGEPAGSGIIFVMSGRVDVYKKKSKDCKYIGPKNGRMLVTLDPVACVGEFAFLTEEPRMASIQAATAKVECWIMKKDDCFAFVDSLTEAKFNRIIGDAFASRNQTMHLSYGMTEPIMRRKSVFEPCDSSVIKEYIQLLKPYAVPKKFQIIKGDCKADNIYFLMNGRCGVLRYVPTKKVENKIQTTKLIKTHVHTLRAPSVIADTAVLHGSQVGDSIVTLSTCDFWVLSKEHFWSVLRRHAGVELRMIDASRTQRQAQLSTQHNLFKDCVFSIPFLRDVATSYALKELLKAFSAKVYKPLSLVISTSDYADRLIILYKGKVKVGDGLWKRGETAGFTCLVPHRWAHSAVSLEVCECLECPIDTYRSILQKYKLYDGMLKFIKCLMFPNAFCPSEVRAAHHGVQDLKSPNFYPISMSAEFSLTEKKFNGMHYAKMIEPREVEMPAVKKWARMSSYLWKRRGPEANQGAASAAAEAEADEEETFLQLRDVGKKWWEKRKKPPTPKRGRRRKAESASKED
eukprot:TRINITY_DN32578_c0_g1_i1.p1 TRINITY_DN32578_c0_g1~~TRINITY_DN32578_c0_g1_i1.p1  ORF type:complete len:947 (+),score=289.32 TRINITY_DN32578_c0_g1_i1:112-2841(+)